jgi:hypothetical protein
LEKKEGKPENVSICIAIGLLNVLKKMQELSVVMDLWPQNGDNINIGVNM